MPEYPGLPLALRYFEQWDHLKEEGFLYSIGIHVDCWGCKSEMILVREVAMMIVTDRLTDKPDWHIKVFDTAIAEKWIEEGLSIPSRPLHDSITRGRFLGKHSDDCDFGQYPRRLETILDRDCLEYCIEEFRAKAKFFAQAGLIPTLDASATMVKLDSLVDESLQEELRNAFAKLKSVQSANPDYHPRTDDKVQNLVHPSLYPLVYGRSRVFQDEVKRDEDIGGSYPPASFWSDTYQWLPSNIKIRDDGTARFTIYINDLHRIKHREVYHTIEELIAAALPAWDLCLKKYVWRSNPSMNPGKSQPRFPIPKDPSLVAISDGNDDNWDPPFKAKETPSIASGDNRESLGAGDSEGNDQVESDSESRIYWEDKERIKRKKTRIPPGQSLKEQYKDLQVIVKMASIELTPEMPDFPAGNWHVEGQMNECIVATALYCLDSENITTTHLDFRMSTDYEQDELESRASQGTFPWLEIVYGTSLFSGSACLQNYGSLETRQVRLLAFPNTFHHRVSPFELKDKTKLGHRRFIALWLVDPLNRIISTANVPPQQQSWWLEQAFSGLDKSKAASLLQSIAKLVVESSSDKTSSGLGELAKGEEDLPAELMKIVRGEFGDALPMSHEEALGPRLKLMEERSATEKTATDQWFKCEYSFFMVETDSAKISFPPGSNAKDPPNTNMELLLPLNVNTIKSLSETAITMPSCRHARVQAECSAGALTVNFTRQPLEKRLAAMQHSGKLAKNYSDSDFILPVDAIVANNTFPAPLVFPDDALAIDPDYPPQDLKSLNWFYRERPVTSRKNIVYVISPPKISQEVAELMRDWLKPSVPAKEKVRGLPAGVMPPSAGDVCEYLRAFYGPLEVKLLGDTYEWQAWTDRPGKKVAQGHYIGLATAGPSADLTRVRYRQSPDGISMQLNLNDITDAMLHSLPADAYAMAMLTDHDLYEDEEDDFCCGRAFGGSRISVVSSFRYNPALSRYADIDFKHMWPASHCKKYVDFMCGEEAENAEQRSKTPETSVLSLNVISPLTAAVAAATPVMVPKSSEDYAALWLARVARTASHELGHCFGMDHCVYYACAMQGTSNIAEDDRQPPYLCPVCATKVASLLCTQMGKSGVVMNLKREWLKLHYEALAAFCAQYGGRSGMFAGFKAWIEGMGRLVVNE
ncbi:hypothetical protein HJFPF1_04414 [Paramyrothecium foliicola]|nr:hypothetical protein HJFPF1_04414 [Paramyrothecium foliicola]